MKVADYIKNGLKNRVEEKPEGYEILGEAKEGIHKVICFGKIKDGRIIDAKYTSSKRCKKLMAVADLVCDKIKNQIIGNISVDEDEVLSFFKEEKDKEKLKNRLGIVLKALNL